jgi:hypothetical protein
LDDFFSNFFFETETQKALADSITPARNSLNDFSSNELSKNEDETNQSSNIIKNQIDASQVSLAINNNMNSSANNSKDISKMAQSTITNLTTQTQLIDNNIQIGYANPLANNDLDVNK